MNEWLMDWTLTPSELTLAHKHNAHQSRPRPEPRTWWPYSRRHTEESTWAAPTVPTDHFTADPMFEAFYFAAARHFAVIMMSVRPTDDFRESFRLVVDLSSYWWSENTPSKQPSSRHGSLSHSGVNVVTMTACSTGLFPALNMGRTVLGGTRIQPKGTEDRGSSPAVSVYKEVFQKLTIDC